MPVGKGGQAMGRTGAFVSGVVAAAVSFCGSARADVIAISAFDSGFVTEMGGSAKGDGTVAPTAAYNYSVGFELHYGSGALFSPLAPMYRKNYFVFDLSSVTEPLTEAKLTLWTGTLESSDLPGEVYALHEITDMPAALAGGTMSSAFDSPSDPLVMDAALLYTKLADGPLMLGAIGLTTAMDDTFVEITFSAAGVAYLSTFIGGSVVLSGLVPSAVPPTFPQQPFGLTGPDIPGGDSKTPLLTLTTIPEPRSLLLVLLATAAITRRPRGAALPRPAV